MNQRAKELLKKHLPSSAINSAKRVRNLIVSDNKPKGPAFPNPTILTDAFDIKFVYYPWETSSVEDLISRSFYKPEFLAMNKLVSDGDTVFDVGANVGIHCAFISKVVGKKGHVFAFEPVPNTFWMLQETMAINKLENVTANRAALSDKEGTLKMNVFADEYSVWSSFGNPDFDGVKPIGKVDVEIKSLDKYCSENSIDRIDFLKIDVEGFELQVLQGAREMLSKGNVGSLSFEISQIPLEGAGGSAKAIFDILESHGYKAYKYKMESDSFDGPYFDSDDFYENFYASKKDLTKL